MSLGAPLGLLALLGIPALIAIHFLQRRQRRVWTSTSFLLEEITPPDDKGRRFERLRSSLSLFLQLFCLLVIVWLLCDPLIRQRERGLKLAIVIDSSYSMRAFREKWIQAVAGVIDSASAWSEELRILAISSDRRAARIYYGRDGGELIKRLSDWRPSDSAHDPADALALARAYAEDGGLTYFITDKAYESDEDVGVIGVGRVLDNVGFSGIRVETEKGKTQWRAILRNYSQRESSREWQIRLPDGRLSPAKSIHLKAGESRELSGEFPDGHDRFTLVLPKDDFRWDDELPVIRPLRKELKVALDLDEKNAEVFRRLFKVVGRIRVSNDQADIVFTRNEKHLGSKSHVMYMLEGKSDSERSSLIPVTMPNPLVEGLDFQGLLCSRHRGVLLEKGDRVLLLQGKDPLIFLREKSGRRFLVFNFDLYSSNALRLPATVILVQRFIESCREDKVGHERRIVETAQDIAIAVDRQSLIFTEQKTERKLEASMNTLHFRSPMEAGFFEVKKEDSTLFEAASHFSDVREADFLNAESYVTRAPSHERAETRYLQSAPFPEVLVMLLLMCLLFDWYQQARRRRA